MSTHGLTVGAELLGECVEGGTAGGWCLRWVCSGVGLPVDVVFSLYRDVEDDREVCYGDCGRFLWGCCAAACPSSLMYWCEVMV